jgi:hypothetical protein
VAKSVTRAVTHLIRSAISFHSHLPLHPQPNSPPAEHETKKCHDARVKGIEIVDEDFVRELCVVEEEDEEDEDEDGNDEKEEKECYLTEMLNMGADDEGFPPFSKKAIGMKLAISEESTNPNLDSDATYVVVSYRPVVGTTGLMKIKNLDNEEADLIEADFTVLIDDFRTLPPKAATELWDKYQNRKISEGVWEGVAAPSLLAEINALVDALAAQEPVDFHPGTKEVVRDLVHPSLFPLLSDPSTRDVTKKNFWGRPHEASRFQWLPAEVEIDESGNPHFASDINNLDRSKYSALYGGLEGLFKELLPGFQKVWQYARSMTFTEEEEDWDEDIEVEEPDLINFHGSTLQAVVKIADYEFQPGAEFDGVWHYEGMSHENIVMTGLFYPNSDEDLKGGLEFKRMFNDSEAGKILFGVNQQRARWFEEMIQMGFIPLGQTTTETGKLLVFPNCHAHRVMKMVNNTPNVLRRRLVVFFIIDPNDRIPSSRDFPPLPRQISLEQALADRLELMQERKQAKQSLNPREIELCEH